MKTAKLIVAAALAVTLGAGLAQAKIPAAPMDDAAKTKAEEKKVKDAAAAKKAGEELAKAQDRVVALYKKGHGKSGKPEAMSKGAKPAAKK